MSVMMVSWHAAMAEKTMQVAVKAVRSKGTIVIIWQRVVVKVVRLVSIMAVSGYRWCFSFDIAIVRIR